MKIRAQIVGIAAALAFVFLCPCNTGAKVVKNAQQLREEYLARVTQSSTPPDQAVTGSLWIPGGALTNLAGDYKAAHVHDTIIIHIVHQTTATATGTTDTQRAYNMTSAITGLPGGVGTSGVNPLYASNSGTKLKGQGSVSNNSTLQTSLSGQVIAVLPNGNLVVEAQREVLLNHERETAVVRGIARPGDVGPDNTVQSTALSDLEVELKGKGVITDVTRQPNRFVRTMEWLFSF